MRFLVVLAMLMLAMQANAMQLAAKSGYVIHPATGTVLLNQNGDEKMGPASLTKMMTLYLLFDALKTDHAKLSDEFPVSEKAWRMGGSKMFVKVGTAVPVEQLIQGIAVVSGNDACVVVAEKLGGTEEGFASMMNRKAQELGMTNTNFVNASGWPDPNQYSSAHDMAILLTALLNNFPEYNKYLREEEFVYNGIKQQNRNGLLHAGAGVDVGKTGHTEESGYHLASSAVQNGERLVTVVMGTDGFSTREGESLKAYATFFAQNRTHDAARKGEVIAEAPVWQGTVDKIGLTVAEPIAAFVDPDTVAKSTLKAKFKQPLVAPFAADMPVGELTLTLPNGQVMTTALVPAQPVERAGFMKRWMQTAGSLF